MKFERRSVAFEVRVDGSDESPRLEGHAAVFDSLSVELWGFREKIAQGAFTKTIQETDVRALWNHNPDYVLGRTKSGTLRLSEDTRGLKIDVDPPDTQWAKDLTTTIRRGDVDQMSFAFRAVKEQWDESGDMPIRTILEAELRDVSPVTFPAYEETNVQARSALSEAGIDFDGLSRVVVRSRHGLAVTETDHELVRVSIDVLNGILSEEPGQGAHSEDPEHRHRVPISLLLKQLELAESTID